MSTALKQAAVDEALELSWLFRQNAAMRNGVPDVKKTHAKLEDEPPKEPAPPVVIIAERMSAAETATADTAATGSPSPGATAAAPAKGSLLRRAAPWLLATAIGGTALGGLAGWFLKDRSVPVSEPDTPQTAKEQERSMLQWLQDRGRHLPEGVPWQQQ